MIKWIKSNKKKLIGIVVAVISLIALGLIVGFVVYGHSDNSNNGSVTTISEASIEKVLEISDLSTLSNTYNAIVKVKDEEDPNEVLYYVAYEGTVKIGIDFSEIQKDVNKEEKIITLTLPDTKVLSVTVDMGTMEYIFNDKKSETETVSKDAYKYAKDDLMTRVEAEEGLHELARENAVETVRALVEPWVKQVDSEYSVDIV